MADSAAFDRAAVEASARQLSEQPGFVMVPVEPSEAMIAAIYGGGMANLSEFDLRRIRTQAKLDWTAILAARPLTASPTAPSTEASEPVLKWCNSCGEGVTTFCRAKTPDAERDCPFFDELGEVARTTPPPAPVLSDAEIPNIEWLANVIRIVDGSNTLGAGELAEKITLAMQARIWRLTGNDEAIEQAIGRASRGAK